MKNYTLLLMFFCLTTVLLSASCFSQTAEPNPSPQYIYYCLNEPASPLTALPSTGGMLRWYTSQTGGTFSTTAPTPSTANPATGGNPLIFYVTQVIGGVESSPRTPKFVYVNQQLDLFCQTVSPNSITFDFANTGQSSFTYSYTVDGGVPITGTHFSPSNFTITGLIEGQTVVFTLTAVGAKVCVTPQTTSCKTTCLSTVTTPNFNPIVPICSGSPPPILASTSPNGIMGSWSPALVSNTVSGNYVFTPNSTLHPCATTQTLNVTVLPLIAPTFTGIPVSVCQNSSAPVLPLNSNNTPSILGIWSPATVNTALIGPVTYTFTPNSGQCTSASPTMLTVTVVGNNSPGFNAIDPFCAGSMPPSLATTSPNGITGTWSPSVINNTNSGSYLFTPSPNQCSTNQTLNVIVTSRVNPGFAVIPAFCEGTIAPVLATSSPNGIAGTWSPPQIDNRNSGTYVFTPNNNECATTQSLTTTVNGRIVPGFSSFSICSGSVPPNLDSTSPSGISGSWSPAVVDNLASGSYTFTPDTNQCATDQTINVVVNPSNTLTDFTWTVSEAFANNQVVTISASSNNGEYSYRLDDGPLQTSSIFEFVNSGYHTVTVIENNGCSNPISKSNILVIDYPRFFTPNGDGFNETWNILTLADDTSAKIRIFDRYGKLLKEIYPNNDGWNGLYIGQPMPSDDYWFVVEYTEQNILKQFRSHFSLKR
jgi:gliding motility-associated-like protein